MRKRSGRKGRLVAVLLSAAVLCQAFPVYSIGAAQETDGTCTHHPAHTAECGYADGTAACQFVCGECQKEQEGLAKAEQEAKQETENVQGMIDALPDAGTVTAENLESVKAQIAAIDEAKTGLDETQQGSLVLEKYYAVVERIAAVEAEVEAARKAEEEAKQAAQEAQKKIENVQKMIDALPEAETVMAENLENIKTQLAAIEEARAGLNESQQAALSMEKYTATVERVAAMEVNKVQKAPANTQRAGSENETGSSVAKVEMNDKTIYFDSLDDAIKNVGVSTATITLLKDAALTKFVGSSIKGNITLVGGSYTITCSQSGTSIEGNLTIESGNFTGGSLYLMERGILNVKGGKIKCIEAVPNSTSTLNIYGGSIEKLEGTFSKVEYHVDNITLNKNKLSLIKGTTDNLTVQSAISTPDFPKWTSSNTNVVTVVGNGVNVTVTAVGVGTASITVKVGDKTATCDVTVTALKPSTMNMTITGATGDNTKGYTCAYNSAITLNAMLEEQKQNTLAENAGNGTVSFYLGDSTSGTLFGTEDVSDNKASLALTLSGETWDKGFKMLDPNKITAVFSGNDTWESTTSSVNLTVKKAAQTGTPSVPTQSKTTENSITLESMNGGANGVEFGYVEGETGDTQITWKKTTTFDNLEPGTPYTFYARYAGNDYYEPSTKSNGITLYTLPEITTDSLKATVKQTFNAQLEAKVAAGTNVTWELINNSELPDGLSLASDGKISGTPTAVTTNGSASFDVQATANGVTNTKTIFIIVNKGTPSIKLRDKDSKNFVYTYGDTITLEGKITSDSEAADKAANAPAALEMGEAALFLGETQLTEPVTVENNGTFTLTYDTEKQGISATGESQTLTVKYGGNAELNAGSQDVTITLNKASRNGSVTVSGEYVSSNKLTASYKAGDTQTPEGWTLSYQWYRGDSLISGAEGETYTLTASDIGQEIYVKVTGTSAWYYDTVESTKVRCKGQAGTPEDPKQSVVTADSITIKTVSGQKYLCTATDTKPETTSEGWIIGTDGTYTFKELSANTKYVIWTYIPGDDLHIDSDMAKTSITTNLADYFVVISADSMTAGDAESIGNISVTGKTSGKIDLGYTGKVIVTAPETVTLTRKDDTAQIQSALEVQRGQEWQKHHAEKTLAGFTEEDSSPVSIRFSQPQSLNGERMRAGEYEGTMTFTITYEENGKVQELSGSQSVKVTVTIYDRVPSRPTDGLHQGSDGELWYYKDGRIDKTFEGIVEYNGSQFYVKDGKVQKIDGLTLVKDKWYFLTEGRVQTQHTGLVQYDGEWFYITEGILDTSISGVVPYDGGEFVFTQGRLIQELNGLWLNPGDNTWYFIANGQVQRDYTGLALYDGHWFHVVKGVFDQTYTGLVLYDNAWFYVTKGELNTNISGVVPYNGGKFIFSAGRLANEVNGLWLNPKDKKWYFASNGQIQTQYTGVSMYDNEWFYIRKGILATDYNGTIQYNGATFRVRAGQLYEQIYRKR